MTEATKQWLKSPKGKLTAALTAMFLAWIFMFWQFSDSLSDFLPSNARIKTLQTTLKTLQNKAIELREKQNEFDAMEKQYRALIASAWRDSEENPAETILRRRIESAASSSEIKLSGIGSGRITRMNNELFFIDVDVSWMDTLENSARFLKALEEGEKTVFWRQLSLRPMMMQEEQKINCSGAVRIIVFDGIEKNVQPGEGSAG